jgi:hypothetical protein
VEINFGDNHVMVTYKEWDPVHGSKDASLSWRANLLQAADTREQQARSVDLSNIRVLTSLTC